MVEKPTANRPANFHQETLREQAHLVYCLAMDYHSMGEVEKYDQLMGVANLLYMIDCGKYEVTVVEDFDNLGVY
jgi:hypothetical protein